MNAYLILAHNNFSILQKLIEILDDANNDIFIHIDKSVENVDFEKIEKSAKVSRVCFTERESIVWGDISMVKAEYILLKTAEKFGEYKYYHLISGVDLPLLSKEKLNDFWDKNYPKEFIHFSEGMNKIEQNRIRHFHFFPGRRNLFNRAMTKFEDVLQGVFRIDRLGGKKAYRGSQWFSITDKLARYIIQNEEKIMKRLRFCYIPDELFLQNAVMGTEFEKNLYYPAFDDSCRQNVRYIDWKRGAPYTFSEEDFDEIMASGMVFVRKLSEENELPEMIYNSIK